MINTDCHALTTQQIKMVRKQEFSPFLQKILIHRPNQIA